MVTGVLAFLLAVEVVDIAKFDPDMAMKNSVVEGGLRWIDGRDLPLEGKAFADTEAFYDRLPRNVTTNVNSGVRGLKHDSAGLQFRFRTDSRKLAFRWTVGKSTLGFPHMAPCAVSGIDVYRRGSDGKWKFFCLGCITDPTNGILNVNLTWNPKEDCLINLPLYNSVRSFKLGITPGAKVFALKPRSNGIEKPVVFYGCSGTQGACASRPGMAFPSIVGRNIDVPIVNLGFSGSGLMELEMSDHLANIDASCYVLDSVWNMRDWKLKDFAVRYEPFIRNLRARRPHVPIVMPEKYDVFCDGRIDKDVYVRDLYKKLVAEGWRNLYYMPKEMFYPGDGEGTVDRNHPNDWGMVSLAGAFEETLRKVLNLDKNKQKGKR